MLIRTILTTLATPPALNMVMLLAGCLIALRYRVFGLMLVMFSALSLFALSLPVVKEEIYEPLEIYPPVQLTQLQALDPARSAVVVLGGGINSHAPEFSDPTLTDDSFRRIYYAMDVLERVELPLVIAGGTPWDETLSEASRMAFVLGRLGKRARWLEETSKNTWENAAHVAAILRSEGIDTVVLVTDAWHQRRGVECMVAQGLNVLPAPTGFRSVSYDNPRDWMPEGRSLFHVQIAIREWLGILTYRLSYGTKAAPLPDAQGVVPAAGQ